MADVKEEEKGGPSKEDLARIADTNVEGIGSKENRDLRAKAAATEKAWKNAGKEAGLQIWRIEKFKVKKWKKSRYGEFYSGDSYIVLHTMVDDEGKKSYDVFFWLGQDTSQDEAGTAAYKTVELDDVLGDEPVQYREVQGNESTQFMNCFEKITILEGGVDSGFNIVKPKEYKPRLLHVSGYKTHVQVFQVAMKPDSLNNVDSFVLDNGLSLYQFNGPKATAWEKRKAQQVVNSIKNDRHGKVQSFIVVDGLEDDQKEADGFWQLMGHKPKELTDEEEKKQELKMKMLRVSDDAVGMVADGKVDVDVVCDGYLDPDELHSGDVFIVDSGLSIYIWIGSEANKAERREAMPHACAYVTESGRNPMDIPMCRVLENKEPSHFMKLMKSGKKGWDADMIGDEDGFVGRKSSVAVLRDWNETLDEVASKMRAR